MRYAAGIPARKLQLPATHAETVVTKSRLFRRSKKCSRCSWASRRHRPPGPRWAIGRLAIVQKIDVAQQRCPLLKMPVLLPLPMLTPNVLKPHIRCIGIKKMLLPGSRNWHCSTISDFPRSRSKTPERANHAMSQFAQSCPWPKNSPLTNYHTYTKTTASTIPNAKMLPRQTTFFANNNHRI